MGKIIFVTGGSRSGKSKFAEDMAAKIAGDDVLYVATGIATDEDMKERIRLHKLRRNPRWGTFEGYRKLAEMAEETSYGCLLLDCVTVLITNFMFQKERDFDTVDQEEIQLLEKEIFEELKSFLAAIREKDKSLILVSNEVGMSVVSAYRMGRIFADLTGKMNQMIASTSDEVYFCVSGIPMQIK